MAYTIEYKFQKTIHQYSEEHIALIRDENGEAVNCVAGTVVDGWTQEAVMKTAEDWIRRRNKPNRSVFGEGTQDDSYEFGESAQSRAEEERHAQSQAEHNAANAKRVAAEYGGVPIAIKDTDALKAAGCEYKTWEWVDMTDDGPGLTYSTEWQKDGRLLTVICQDYFLVI